MDTAYDILQIEGAPCVLDGEGIGEYLVDVLGLRTFKIARPPLLPFLDRGVIRCLILFGNDTSNDRYSAHTDAKRLVQQISN